MATLSIPDAPRELELEAPDDAGAALWRLARVLAFTTLNRTTLYRLVLGGGFPRPVQLTDHRVAWRAGDVRAWAASRPSAAIGEPAPLAAANARRRGPGRRGRSSA